MLLYGLRAVPSGALPARLEVLLRTFGTIALALQGVAGDPGSALPASKSITTLILDASPLAKIVLAVLLFFSAMSWGIVLYKLWQFKQAQRQTTAFLDAFRRSSRFSEVHAVCDSLVASPLVGLFQAGYAELNAQLRTPVESKPGVPAPRPTLKSFDALDRALLRASTAEVSRLERRIPFLATTASITPYIGLLGTVLGIMSAFQNIAGAGSTSLGVVSQPIAEALVATAAGLFAAIPAVYFYNELTSRVKGFVGAMEDFSMEFLNIAERNFT
jgi:biopolymer transport protein TolQ